MSSPERREASNHGNAGRGPGARHATNEPGAATRSGSREGELIWSRPEPSARKPGLTREQIAEAALELADEEGIDALSMRRIAGELGVGTMSLYYYVRTKDELLTLMHNAMIGELLIAEDALPSEWRPALELIARRSRDAFHRHPWAIKGPPTALGPNALRHGEQSLAAVDRLNVDAPTRFEIITMLDDYVFGCALRELQEAARQPERGGERQRGAIAAYIEAQLATGQFPLTEQIFGRGGAQDTIERVEQLAGPGGDDGQFERGLKRLLDGIALNLP